MQHGRPDERLSIFANRDLASVLRWPALKPFEHAYLEDLVPEDPFLSEEGPRIQFLSLEAYLERCGQDPFEAMGLNDSFSWLSDEDPST
jgi:hypothetical protein